MSYFLQRYQNRKFTLIYRIFRKFGTLVNSKRFYFLFSTLVMLPFAIFDGLTRFRTTRSQFRAGYESRGSLEELKLFEGGGRIGQVFKSLVRGNLKTDVRYDEYREEYVDPFLSQIGDVKLTNVLEVGAGASINLFYVNESFPGTECIGVEYTRKASREAKAYWHNRDVGLSCVVGDARNLPFADSSVDIVFSSHTLEQMEEHRRYEGAISEMHRVARVRIILMEPGYELGNVAQKLYIKLRGTSKHILSAAIKSGYNVRSYRLLETVSNALNPTMMVVIDKK
jgi:ubiquinone/menaquinone biosynthesis C-methylase UbiE